MEAEMERYAAWCPEQSTEEDATTVEAHSAESAARAWARHYDEGDTDYDISSGNYEPVVHVRAPDGTLSRWEGSGEWDPIYSASEVAEDGGA